MVTSTLIELMVGGRSCAPPKKKYVHTYVYTYISLRILGHAYLRSFVDVIVFGDQTPTTMNFDIICGELFNGKLCH